LPTSWVADFIEDHHRTIGRKVATDPYGPGLVDIGLSGRVLKSNGVATLECEACSAGV
jgi:hypothetical protein